MVELTGKELKEYKKTLILTEEQREVLIGTMLGLAKMPAQKGDVMCNIKFEQYACQMYYVLHLREVFEPWVIASPLKLKALRRGLQYVWFQTFRHPAFMFYRNQFYASGKKRVPPLIDQWLTPRVLAYWFMDATVSWWRCGYKFHMHAFSQSDLALLVDVLDKRLGLQCRLMEKCVYIPASSVLFFHDLIRPHLGPGFLQIDTESKYFLRCSINK